MPALSQEEKNLLGKLISPFERSNKDLEKRILKDGESERFSDFIHDGIDNNEPRHNFVYVTKEEVKTYIKTTGRLKEKCFLWVLDDTSIKIIREKTRNTLRTHDETCVCHTNLTGAGQAYVGGEMFFCEDGHVYINFFSDRYGNPSAEVWETAKAYIRKVGYKKLIDIIEFMNNG
jgi:hypothetical protein